MVLSACTGDDGADDATKTPADSGAAGSGAAVVPVVTLAEDGTVEESLASISRPVGDYEVVVDILRVTRFEAATRLELAITPRSRGGDQPFDRNFLSSNGYSGSADGIYLVDTANLLEYRTLRVSDDVCACSRDLEAFPLDQATVLYADFPAVPADVSTLSVVLPSLGPIAGVDVS